ncbi:MAG: hypothetical protein IPK21_15585 [Haliscomenobacter sp.]|nr:hypothetical protein [Haliscomenobacter sp.]
MPNNKILMTRLVLDIPNARDLGGAAAIAAPPQDSVCPLETPEISPAEHAAAIQVIEQGCNMTAFGDPVDYQRSVREDRILPYR